MISVYSFLLLLTLVIGAPYWVLRMLVSGRYRAGLAERLGRVPAHLQKRSVRANAPSVSSNLRGTIWLHAVSVGEVLAATALIAELRKAGYAVAVSTTTQAGQLLARKRLPGCAIFYMPLDFGFLIRRYLRALEPQFVLTIESELWPNLIRECKLAGIPLAVVNARISDRSFPRYVRLKRIWRPFLREITLFCAQSDETAQRLQTLGIFPERIQVSGNLKYDVRTEEKNAMTRKVADLLGETRLIVAGSTLGGQSQPGEEEALLAAWPAVLSSVSDVALLIAPRHPDRFEEVLSLIRKSGHPFIRCSELVTGTSEVAGHDTVTRSSEAAKIVGGTILLLDTIGDLAGIYSLATVAFVGGSLVPRGGHNPLEPAQFAVPVIMGSSYENFREIVETMLAKHAIQIVLQSELSGVFTRFMTEPGAAMELGARGRSVFESEAGATHRTASLLLSLLHEQPGTRT